MLEEKIESEFITAYCVRTAAHITENGVKYKNLVFNVVGELNALSQLIRTKDGFIFLIKLKTRDSNYGYVSVDIVVSECLEWQLRLSSCLHSNLLFKNLSVSSVKYKEEASPIHILIAASESTWATYDEKLVKYFSHEEFLTQNNVFTNKLQGNPRLFHGEKDNNKRHIISYQGTITKVIDSQGGIYEMDGKVTLYLTRLFLQSKFLKFKCKDNIVLHNVHALRMSSKIKLVCCGLSLVHALDENHDEKSTQEIPLADKVFCAIRRLGLNFSQVDWLLSSVSCLDRNLCPCYLAPNWLQAAHLSLSKSGEEKCIFTELFPTLVFGKTEGELVTPPHSLVKDFCSFPHNCNFLTKPCFFAPVVQYCSVNELREYAVTKAMSELGIVGSDWETYFTRSTDANPRKVIVGLLTASTRNGKLCIRDQSGKLDCTITTFPDALKPSNIDSLVKISDYTLTVELFRICDCAMAETLGPLQVLHKVYVSFSLGDIVYLKKASRSRESVGNSKPNSGVDDKTDLSHQLSNLNINSDDNITQSYHSTPPVQYTHNEAKDSRQRLAMPNDKHFIVFQCTIKTPVRYNYKKDFHFGLHAVILELRTDPTAKDFKSHSTEDPKVVQSVQMTFSGLAMKFFHVLHAGCIYKAKLSSVQYQDFITVLHYSEASVAQHVINILHLAELEQLDVKEEYKSTDEEGSSCEYDDRKIFTVTEALSKNPFTELVSIFGVIIKREQLSSEKQIDETTPPYYAEYFKMGVGSWQNKVIQLEIRDTMNELVSTRIFLDIKNLLYPLGLLEGGLVKFTALDGHTSKTNNIYFRSTVMTCVEVLSPTLSANFVYQPLSASLLEEYMSSERLLLSENLAKWEMSSFCRFVCLVDIQRIWNIAMQLACGGCKETIPDGDICSRFGCHTNASAVDKTTISFLASDGSACTNVKCQGDAARRILQMHEDDWWTLLTSSGVDKTWRNEISKEKDVVPHDVGSRILRSASLRPQVYRPVLMEFQWRKTHSSWSSSMQSKVIPGNIASPRLFCSRMEEVTYLTAIGCYLCH